MQLAPEGLTPLAAAMLLLQKHLLPLHRSASLQCAFLLSTAVAAVSSSPTHSAAENYLVTTCGLTREQAAKAAKRISHWKAPSKGDAVLAFHTGPALGLSKADITVLVTGDPRILNCGDNTLRTRVDGFRSHGFSAAQIRSFICTSPIAWRTLNIEKLSFWVSFFGSPDKFLRILRRNLFLITSDLDKVKTNIRLLQDFGLSIEQIGSMCVSNPRLLTCSPDRTAAILVRADEFGVPRNSPKFKQVVITMACLTQETLASKIKMLAKALGCSDAEVVKMVQRNPVVLRCSGEKLLRVSEFLTDVAGVSTEYIQASPTILTYSLDGRLVPRHYVMKVLQEKGLIQKRLSFTTVVMFTDESFYSKFIHPYEDVLPGLANACASACKGKIPT